MESARAATPSDLAALTRLAGDAVAELVPQRGGPMWARTIGRRPPLDEGLAAAIADPDVLVLVGTIGDEPVGYAVVRLDTMADDALLAVIEDLFTEPEAREVGTGEAMLDEIVRWATARGAVGLDAVVLPGARESKNFFESFGLKARALVVHRELP